MYYIYLLAEDIAIENITKCKRMMHLFRSNLIYKYSQNDTNVCHLST